MGDSDSGCDRMKDRHHSTAALLHPCRLYRTPYGGHPLPQHPPLHPPGFPHLQSYPPLLPTECPLFPVGEGNQKNKVIISLPKKSSPKSLYIPLLHDFLHHLGNPILTQCGQLHLPSGAFSISGSRQTMW